MRRHVRVNVRGMPAPLAGGNWKQWTIDATHSNAWHNPDKAELEQTGSGAVASNGVELDRTLAPNSVTVIDVVGR